MEQTFDKVKCKQFIQKAFDQSALPSLERYIEIPNLSRAYDPNWNTNGHLETAAEHIRQWVLNAGVKGLTSEIIQHEGYSPIIYTEVAGDLPVTIFYYGHFDKQPPFTGWFEGFGPNIPIIKDDKLYGRGGADDGYSTYGTILSIKACQQQGVKIPRCVMITEGDEESGSGHLFYYIPKLKQKIGNPLICFCLDSGTLDYQTFWLTNSLRGVANFLFTVQILTEGVHSGDSSGIVPSSFRILRSLLDRLENSTTGELDSAFSVDIPPNRYKQLYDVAQLKGQQAIKSFPFVQGGRPVTNNPLSAILNRGWKATLSVVGASDFPEAKVAGSVLRPKSTFKLSVRLPPTLSGEKVKGIIQGLLLKDVPYGAKAYISDFVAYNGWNAPSYSPFLESAIEEASQTYYGQKRLTIAQGGSIPLMGLFSEVWPSAEFLVTGVLGPQSNAHGPNEFLHLPYVKKLISCMSLILARVSAHYENQSKQ